MQTAEAVAEVEPNARESSEGLPHSVSRGSLGSVALSSVHVEQPKGLFRRLVYGRKGTLSYLASRYYGSVPLHAPLAFWFWVPSLVAWGLFIYSNVAEPGMTAFVAWRAAFQQGCVHAPARLH